MKTQRTAPFFHRVAERTRRAYELLVGIVAALRLVLNPNRLPDVFLIDRVISSPATLERILARIRSDAHAARALREQRRLSPIALRELSALPHGTLGRTFADAMIAQGLDPASIPRKEHRDDATFVQAHLYETHDIWHAVTGFETDVAGELGLQAFYSAQVDGDLPRLLIIGGLINARLQARNDWGRRLDALAQGWTMGRQARALFGVAWDDLWSQPLEQVRALLNVHPAHVPSPDAQARVPVAALAS
jgi:ubiquinone biosynthesis protein COQ4